MIAELDRYHGCVLRQILVAAGRKVRIGVEDTYGRVDTFVIEDSAFQIKHSTKRLSPWQFTYMPENLRDLAQLMERYRIVWAFLVCGQDGVVGISSDEITTLVPLGTERAVGIRARRSRSAMYRIAGPLGELARAKPIGVGPFVEAAVEAALEPPSR